MDRREARTGRVAAAAIAAAAAVVLMATNVGAGRAEAQSARQWRIAVIGDSLAVGYGIGEQNAYPAVLADFLRQSGWSTEVRTFGASGHTTADGLDSVSESTEWSPDLTIIAVGGNDGIRGVRVQQVEHNLRRMIRIARDSGAHVILTGMRAIPRHGPRYDERFANTFIRVAYDTRTDLMPFLLYGVAGVDELNQADRIHPNVEGAQYIASALWPYVTDALTALTEG